MIFPLEGCLSLYDEHNGIELDRRKIGGGQEIADLFVFDRQQEIDKSNGMLVEQDRVNSAPQVLLASTNQITVFTFHLPKQLKQKQEGIF